MKKLKPNNLKVLYCVAIVISVFYLLCSSTFFKPTFIGANGNYTLHFNTPSSSASFKVFSCGEIASYKDFAFNVKGESLFLDFVNCEKQESLKFVNKQIKQKRARLVFEEVGEWGICEYYYSPLIKNYVIIKNKKVNLQIAYSLTSVTLGSPMIFGSF